MPVQQMLEKKTEFSRDWVVNDGPGQVDACSSFNRLSYKMDFYGPIIMGYVAWYNTSRMSIELPFTKVYLIYKSVPQECL